MSHAHRDTSSGPGFPDPVHARTQLISCCDVNDRAAAAGGFLTRDMPGHGSVFAMQVGGDGGAGVSIHAQSIVHIHSKSIHQ